MTVDNHQQDRLRPLALLALGRNGADIECLVREVRRQARRSGRSIGWADLETALRAGQEAMSGDLRKRAAIHEAGHALVYTVTGVAEVQSASIGLNGIGMVTTIANAELPQTETWLMSSLACVLAGRAAELLVFKEALAGAGGADDSDLAQATHMALAAETGLGFCEHQPLIYHPTTIAAHQLSVDRELADRVNLRLERAEAVARSILEKHRRALAEIAAALEDVGILSGDEIRRIVRQTGGMGATPGAAPKLRDRDS
ncbi:ATP-dependent Zn protease [Rhizobium sp. NTR19]|uniref:ATP-dependent Zn protease n=1 Tax=Neorhizobium turbinariae TaxID=2937795 RepID=A0ABT0IVI6_9HYPH|nr:ATP-dependent Zn protease [Neorhizobium turbinariae]MCK8781892.1 ATP-dependent Zn protease [Neorhizobium turbinariae]